MKTIDKMGVLVLLAHLIITLVIAGGYIGIYAYTGNSDETLKLALFSIIGYWFGAVGNTAIRPNAQTQINNPSEVRITQPPDKEV